MQERVYAPSHHTVFAAYDLLRVDDDYRLEQTQVESSTVDDLFAAFRANLEVPDERVFLEVLEEKADTQIKSVLQLKLE